jgi:hypothetical protein
MGAPDLKTTPAGKAGASAEASERRKCPRNQGIQAAFWRSKGFLNTQSGFCRDGPDCRAAFRNRRQLRAGGSGPFRTT